MKFTVITCSYKPNLETLARVFEGLRKQTLPKDQWEYIIVDNDAQDSLRSWADLTWHPSSKIIVESKLGLANARLRGITESQADYLVFVDQDNILFPNYLERAAEILSLHPFIGSLGGFSIGEYQGRVEPWMNEILAIMDSNSAEGQNVDLQYAMTKQPGPWIPMGAGMIVTRQVAEEYKKMMINDPARIEFGRKGKSLMGSEDADIAMVAVDLNLACGMSALLKLTHVIPTHRIELQYLRRLMYSSNYATARLLIMRGWKKEAISPPPTLIDRMRAFKTKFLPGPPDSQCWKAYAKGYHDGITGQPFDETYA